MNLDRRTFATELQHLAERFNRQAPSSEMTRRYYRALEHLDTRTFQTAALQIYNSDTFWPSPHRFLEAAGLDPATQSRNAWHAIDTAVRQGTTASITDLEAAHPHTREALRDVGGLAAIGRCDEVKDLPHIARRFQAAYRAAALQRETRRAALEDTPLDTPTLWTGPANPRDR